LKRQVYILPLAIFAVLAVYFAIGLTKDLRILPSVLKNQSVPNFYLPPIEGRDRGLSSKDLVGEVSLVNIFGSWCDACRVEHPFLMQIRAEKRVPLHGIDWLEKNPGAGAAWLAKLGDPYTFIGDDPESRAAIAFGVSGAPETFVVDKRGVIRYKHIGPMSEGLWQETLLPIIAALRKQ